jgi:hypothetical protein
MAARCEFGRGDAARIRALAAVNVGAALSAAAAAPRVWVRNRGKDDEFRLLAIPTVCDRVAAGAAHAVLEDLFEPRFHDSSLERGVALRFVSSVASGGLPEGFA